MRNQAQAMRILDEVTGINEHIAQIVMADGSLADDFLIVEAPNAINVLNAPSPAATASIAIGRHIANLASKSFNLS